MFFKYSRRVYLGDTDAAGVIYFAKGMEICHEAYEELLASSGISLQGILQAGKIALPIVAAEINFFRPLCCGDRLEIVVDPKLLDRSKFKITYEIFNLDIPAQLAAKAQTKHVCIDPQTRTKINLPDDILAIIKKC